MPGKLYESYFNSAIMKSNKPDSDCFNVTNTAFITSLDFKEQLRKIKEICKDKYFLTIVTDKSYSNQFKIQVAIIF